MLTDEALTQVLVRKLSRQCPCFLGCYYLRYMKILKTNVFGRLSGSSSCNYSWHLAQCLPNLFLLPGHIVKLYFPAPVSSEVMWLVLANGIWAKVVVSFVGRNGWAFSILHSHTGLCLRQGSHNVGRNLVPEWLPGAELLLLTALNDLWCIKLLEFWDLRLFLVGMNILSLMNYSCGMLPCWHIPSLEISEI